MAKGPTSGSRSAPARHDRLPAGRIAHSFENTSDAPLVYLALSNRLPHDVAEYPDSDKVLIRGTRLMLRRTPKLEYLDGEDAFLAGCAPESPAQ
ncbi:MAG: hypothetical protein R3F62_01880 [Planctomycetota bacterium]